LVVLFSLTGMDGSVLHSAVVLLLNAVLKGRPPLRIAETVNCRQFWAPCGTSP